MGGQKPCPVDGIFYREKFLCHVCQSEIVQLLFYREPLDGLPGIHPFRDFATHQHRIVDHPGMCQAG